MLKNIIQLISPLAPTRGLIITEKKRRRRQKNLIIKVPFPRKEMAEHMGIQRPSLSRELGRMREEGIIEFDKEFIVVKNLETLNFI